MAERQTIVWVWNWVDFMKAEADNGQGTDKGCQR